MRRLAAAVLVIVLAFFASVWAQPILELEDLHLVAVEEVPQAGYHALGSVSGAILMAWHAEHGYPRLLPDLNGDGRIDREDTIDLAIQFIEPMRAHEDWVLDVLLVEVLAGYVAERYPDEFQMWVYDASFPEEMIDHLGYPFDPFLVPGIEIVLLDDPTHDDYVRHLEERRPGVVGVGKETDQANYHTVSRSAVLVEEPDGWPVDLVSTGYGTFGQSSIWDTFLLVGPERWQFVLDWLLFESFVVLVPVDNHEGNGHPGDDPGDDPGDPFDPGDPNDPGDPGDPGDPFDPGDPSDPGDPFEPGEPSDPGNPFNPGEPGDPGQPSDPGGDTGRVPIPWITIPQVDPIPGGPIEGVVMVVVDACHLYQGPTTPMLIEATYSITNNYSVTIGGGTIVLGAGASLVPGILPESYSDIDNYVVPMIAPGDTHTFVHRFDIPAPPQKPTGTSVVVAYGDGQVIAGPHYLQPDQDQCGGYDGPSGGDGSSGDPEPQPDPEPTGLPNLWVTDMTGCWTWSNDGQEHVVATVTGIVHNGGQASASNVRARVTAGGKSTTVLVGTLAAGSQKTISATIDVGPYDTTSWPVSTSITADYGNLITEADESNNTTNSAFPQSSDCN